MKTIMLGTIKICEHELLKGSKVAYKTEGRLMVSPAIFSLVRLADERRARSILRTLRILDFDEFADRDEFANKVDDVKLRLQKRNVATQS